MYEIDWSDMKNQNQYIDPKELARLESPSGEKCPVCKKEMVTGEYEAFGTCYSCQDEY